MQLSLAELKQEVNAAKSLSNSASAVLQTSAGLQDAQYKLSAPATTDLSATASLELDDAKHVPNVPIPCEDGPAPPDLASRPELIQWLVTGVSQCMLQRSPDRQYFYLGMRQAWYKSAAVGEAGDTAVRLAPGCMCLSPVSAEHSNSGNEHADRKLMCCPAGGPGPGDAGGREGRLGCAPGRAGGSHVLQPAGLPGQPPHDP